MTRILTVAVVVVLAACSGARQDGEPRSSLNLITAEQIEETRATNAYELVERLRSRWLRTQGRTQLRPGATEEFEVQVYLDDVRLGGVDRLREIPSGDVAHVRYFPPTEASARYGFDHGAGVIAVSTRPES